MAKTVEAELVEATGARQGSKVGVSWREHLARKVDNVDDETWDGLSKKAQGWYNKAVDAVERGESVPEFPDEAPPKKAAKKKAAKKKAAKKKAAKVTKSDSAKGSVSHEFRRLMLRPSGNGKDRAAILALQQESGESPSDRYSSVIWSETMDVLRVLSELGLYTHPRVEE